MPQAIESSETRTELIARIPCPTSFWELSSSFPSWAPSAHRLVPQACMHAGPPSVRWLHGQQSTYIFVAVQSEQTLSRLHAQRHSCGCQPLNSIKCGSPSILILHEILQQGSPEYRFQNCWVCSLHPERKEQGKSQEYNHVSQTKHPHPLEWHNSTITKKNCWVKFSSSRWSKDLERYANHWKEQAVVVFL